MGENIPDLLVAVNRRIRHAARRQLDPHGVTPAQLRALRSIALDGGGLRMTELAARLGIAKRSATDVVDGLVERGLAERVPDQGDRRAVLVGLTAAGSRFLATLAQRRRDAAEQLLDVLDSAERDQLGGLLAKVAGSPDPCS